jgi:hypothetical protein
MQTLSGSFEIFKRKNKIVDNPSISNIAIILNLHPVLHIMHLRTAQWLWVLEVTFFFLSDNSMPKQENTDLV